jgi:hypothetical protein
MSVTREELAAFADGELIEPRRSEVAAAVAADAALAGELESHRALKDHLSAHFAPILEQPIPERLTAPLATAEPKVVDLTTAKQRRALRGIPRWSWVVAPALAASLALAVFLPRDGGMAERYAGPQLAAALDDQLAASQASDAPTHILLSFRKGDGRFCRAFSGNAQSGIACKDANGWQLLVGGASAETQPGDYRMASSSAPKIMAKAQELADGPALTAEQEKMARNRGWR